ncbi:hypothetical protein KXD96_11735 [Mycobacterium sp. SMC-2]|uniref:hypothetical protein n=1 Tax=Mycobacterium sp. SMC-2 TaxID=2857058 RepID=UPI0021B473FC|nr:hypothetical protein [Mycobacterium sp. SMC-2]UXA08674.1 hypothetical protein KXD96_11735 [Mycobacterium sp. SMC-2]
MSTLYPCTLRTEWHPTGSLVDVVLDTSDVHHTRICLTKDLAIQLRHQLDNQKALHSDHRRTHST